LSYDILRLSFLKEKKVTKFFKFIFCALATCWLVSCGKAQEPQKPDQPSPAPTHLRVALIPVMSHIRVDLPWDVTDELTETLRTKMADGTCFSVQVIDSASIDKIGSNEVAESKVDLFDRLIFVELLQHEQKDEVEPKEEVVHPLSHLFMGVRMRIIDISQGRVEVIRDEVVESSHPLPRSNHLVDYRQNPWGSSSYEMTPLCVAHGRLGSELFEAMREGLLLNDH
jgi:hypothetical protein